MKRTVFVLALFCAGMAHAQKVKLTFSGNVNDATGNSNNATNYGATLTSDRWGTSNSAYSFDGINDYMTIPSAFDFQNRTIKFWALLNQHTSNPQEAYVSDNANLSYGLTAVAAMPSAGDQLRTIAGSLSCDNMINTGQWYMITLAVKNDSVFVYIDSNQVCKKVNNFVKSSDGLAKTVLGASRGANNSYWGGKIDDVAVWDSYMNPAEVRNMYMNEAGLTASTEEKFQLITPTLNFSVNPNPVAGADVKIQFNNPLIIQEKMNFKIYSSIGQLIYEGTADAASVSISRELFSTGLYFVSMSSAVETKTVQFVVAE